MVSRIEVKVEIWVSTPAPGSCPPPAGNQDEPSTRWPSRLVNRSDHVTNMTQKIYIALTLRSAKWYKGTSSLH